MDPIALSVVVLVGAAVVIWYFNRDKKSLDINEDGKVDAADLSAAVDSAKAGVKAEVAKAKAEVKAAVAEAKAKLPTAAKLKAMTKAQLEEVGREFGIELDKRKTKDSMIASLKSEVKKQKH
jgi:hypothetical protein